MSSFDHRAIAAEPATPVVEESRPRIRLGALVNVVLFCATVVTTTIAGALNANVPMSQLASRWEAGLPFSITLMSILLIHEMGHYVLAWIHRVPATLPFFLPAPPYLVGTFGAFIRMKSSPRTRRALFDVGAAGPWAGFVIALPAAAWGLWLSELERIVPGMSGVYFGDSLIFRLLSFWIVGPIPTGFDVILHPVAMAAWFGLFVTSLNLLPIGQLDGGHVVYSLFGHRHRIVARISLAAILGLGFLGWFGWFFWAVLVVTIGLDHPPTEDRATPLEGKRRVFAWATLGLFFLTIVPVPFSWFEAQPARPGAELQTVGRVEGVGVRRPTDARHPRRRLTPNHRMHDDANKDFWI